jgi:hypothetical protein
MATLARVMQKLALKQTMLYWEKTGSDTFGKPSYTPDNPMPPGPVSLACRWEDKQQEIILPDNRKVLSKGYLLLLQDLKVGSLVFLGTLTNWQALPTYPKVPTVNQGGREVLLVRTTPDLLERCILYQAYL